MFILPEALSSFTRGMSTFSRGASIGSPGEWDGKNVAGRGWKRISFIMPRSLPIVASDTSVFRGQLEAAGRTGNCRDGGKWS